MNLYEAQWLACVLPYRRFAAALTDNNARLGANVDRYSLIASDLHRLLVAGLPAHYERFWMKIPARPSHQALRNVEVSGDTRSIGYSGEVSARRDDLLHTCEIILVE